MAQNQSIMKINQIIENINKNWDNDYKAVFSEDGGIEIKRCGILIMGCDQYGRIWEDGATPDELESFNHAINYPS
jgi:hypothetical protein